MHSWICVVRGSRPSATTFMQRSRSVTTPTTLRLCSFSITGTTPASWSRMRLAARCAVSDGTQHAGSFVMTCLIFMVSPSGSRTISRSQRRRSNAGASEGYSPRNSYNAVMFARACRSCHARADTHVRRRCGVTGSLLALGSRRALLSFADVLALLDLQPAAAETGGLLREETPAAIRELLGARGTLQGRRRVRVRSTGGHRLRRAKRNLFVANIRSRPERVTLVHLLRVARRAQAGGEDVRGIFQ